MIGALRRLHTASLDLLFPRRCVVCGKVGVWACRECGAFESQFLVEEMEDFPILSLFDFKQPLVRELIHNLKYGGITEAGESLVELARLRYKQQEILDCLPLGPVLVPIPVSKARLKMRGYNQAAILAESLANWLGLEMYDGLRRLDKDKSQVGKTKQERESREIRFEIRVNCEKYSGRPWVLVDDVCTTGTTLRKCAETLRQAGVSSVGSLVIARDLL